MASRSAGLLSQRLDSNVRLGFSQITPTFANQVDLTCYCIRLAHSSYLIIAWVHVFDDVGTIVSKLTGYLTGYFCSLMMNLSCKKCEEANCDTFEFVAAAGTSANTAI
jgi:hypothetical protein